MRSPRATAHLARPTAFLLATLGLLGCPPGAGDGAGGAGGGASDLPRQVPACATDFPDDFPETRSVEIGAGTGADFTPWPDGQTVTLIQGNQGLQMTTPTLRVTAADSDPETACLRVRLVNDYHGYFLDDPGAIDALLTNAVFVRDGAHYVSDGAFYNALSFSKDQLHAIDITLTAIVQGPGFQAEYTMTIVFD